MSGQPPANASVHFATRRSPRIGAMESFPVESHRQVCSSGAPHPMTASEMQSKYADVVVLTGWGSAAKHAAPCAITTGTSCCCMHDAFTVFVVVPGRIRHEQCGDFPSPGFRSPVHCAWVGVLYQCPPKYVPMLRRFGSYAACIAGSRPTV